MLKKIQYFASLLFIFTLMFSIPGVSRVLGSESEMISRIIQAEDSLEAAYLSVLEIERSGGDVSELVAFLNIALEYFSEANRAFESEDYETAVQLIGMVHEFSNVVLKAGIDIVFVTERVENTIFRNKLFLSFGAICFIVLFGFLGWRIIKVYHIRRMTELAGGPR